MFNLPGGAYKGGLIIVKTPGKSYVNGLTASDLCTPDYEKVMKQMRLTWKLRFEVI